MAEYIKREALLEKCHWVIRSDGTRVYVCHAEDIEAIPAADVAPVRHGRWIECDYLEPCIHGFGTIRRKNKGLKCNQCVHVFEAKSLWRQNFCPNCGAKMDGGEEDG